MIWLPTSTETDKVDGGMTCDVFSVMIPFESESMIKLYIKLEGAVLLMAYDLSSIMQIEEFEEAVAFMTGAISAYPRAPKYPDKRFANLIYKVQSKTWKLKLGD
jgi:hypothetical protein